MRASHKQTPARVAPLALITTLLLIGLYLLCRYYNVPVWLTVVFAVTLVGLCIHAVKRAFRADGWMNIQD